MTGEVKEKEALEPKKICQYCNSYSRRMKQCSVGPEPSYTARKNTCHKYSTIKTGKGGK